MNSLTFRYVNYVYWVNISIYIHLSICALFNESVSQKKNITFLPYNNYNNKT